RMGLARRVPVPRALRPRGGLPGPSTTSRDAPRGVASVRRADLLAAARALRCARRPGQCRLLLDLRVRAVLPGRRGPILRDRGGRDLHAGPLVDVARWAGRRLADPAI